MTLAELFVGVVGLLLAWRQLRHGQARSVLSFECRIGPSATGARATGTIDDPGIETHNGPTVLRVKASNAAAAPTTLTAVGARAGRWPRRTTACLPGEPFTLAPGGYRTWTERWSKFARELGGAADKPMTFRPFAQVHGRWRRVYGKAFTTTGRERKPAIVKVPHITPGRPHVG